MEEKRAYKIAILFLLGVVFLQWIFMATKPKVAPKISLKAPVAFKGEIAIVLDDWGYNLNNLEAVEKINVPITCSVLPHLPYSKQVCVELHSRGQEAILHLPMEPREKMRLEKNTLLVSMDEAEGKNIIEQGINELPFIKGISNHMGSLATEDAPTMEIVFKELKKRGMYFLDSFVTPKSVCAGLARKMGLRFVRRDVFLDNVEEPAYIKNQIERLKVKARANGRAIGIGHDRKVTLEVLGEVIPELKKEGYKFVFASELAR